MAGKPATADSKPKTRPKSGRGAAVGALMVALTLCALTFVPTTIVILCGMLPTVVAFVANRNPHDPGPLCVLSMNFVGVLPHLLDLWARDHSIAHATQIVSDPFNWAMMYSAAALGMVIGHIVPPTIAGGIVAQHRSRLASIAREQQKLAKDWGDDVGGGRPMLAEEFLASKSADSR